MALYRTIQTSFWRDRKVAEDFTPEDKFFYLYLMTNESTSLTGCYELSLKLASVDTGYNEETVKRLMERMEKVHNVVRYDMETHEILILNWSKYNWTKSATVIEAIKKQAQTIKSEEFKKHVLDLAEDRVPIPYGYGGGTSNANANANTNTVAKSPPTIEEVRTYCEKRNNKVDAEAFIAYYESQGWKKANGQPVIDWKGCVRTWEQRDKKKEQPSDRTKGGFSYL